MNKKIRVTQTRVYEYTPDLDHGFYVESDITSVEQALEADRVDVENGRANLDHLAYNSPEVSYTWEIIDDPVP